MREEPVAWMSPDGKFSTTEGKLFYIPLYTTPQIHQLNDEYVFICKRCGDELNIKYEEQKND